MEHIDILPSVANDHSVVHLKFALSGQNSRGKSYWKFNNSLTEDTNFVESMKVNIKEVMQEISETDDPRVNWEFLKYKMRQSARQYSITRASGRREKRITLEKKVYDLERAISESTDPNLVQEYNDAKEELGKLYDYITQGIILRSRAKWYEEGEKSSSYFLRLEKRNKSKSHIRKLIVDDNIEKIETDDSAILHELRKFYSTLYSKKSVKTEAECMQFLQNINTPKLSDPDTVKCEGKLTLKEAWDTLLSMANNKSPGNDGFTKEFYVCLWGSWDHVSFVP